MYESLLDGVIFLWPAYREGEAVYIQNKLLIPATVIGTFETSNPYAQVEERQTLSEDRELISEWQVSVGDIARFLNRLTMN